MDARAAPAGAAGGNATGEREPREEGEPLAETLYRIGTGLVSELDLDRVVQRLTDEATRLVRASFGAFFYNVEDARGGRFMLFTLSGAPREAFARFGMPRNTAVFSPTFAGEGVVRSDDITKDARYGKNAPHRGMPEGHLPVRSYLAVPVWARSGEVLGGLFFGHPEPGVFRERDERAILGLAAHAAVAIENARLFQAAREAEARLRLAVESAAIGTWDFDPESRTLSWDARCKEVFGLVGQAEIDYDVFLRLLHPEDRRPTEEAVGRALDPSGSGEFSTEYRAVLAGGETRWVAARGKALFDAARTRAVRFIGTVIDVTERKLSEERSRIATRQAMLGAEVGAVLTSRAELDVQLQGCAEAIVRHLGAAFARVWLLREAENVLELVASAGMYTHLSGAHGRVPVGAFKIGKIAEEKRPHLTNDVLGDERVSSKEWAAREGMVAFAGYPLLVDGRLVGVVAMFSRSRLDEGALRALGSVADSIALGIERMQGEEARRAALAEAEWHRARLTSLFLQAPAAICSLRGNDHVFQFVNPRYEALVGRSELVGKPLREALPEIEGQGIIELLDRILKTGEPFVGDEFPVALRRQPGGPVEEGFFNFVYQPSRGPRGEVDGIVVFAFEVTEQVLARRRVEKLMAELSAKNQELDQFAYVASHDLKAPLRGIASLSAWIEEELGDKLGEEGRQHMHLLRGRVFRLEALINGILDYSRAGRMRGAAAPVDTGRLVAEVVELLSPPEGAVIDVQPEMPTVLAERVQLQQVFMNLLSNALKHARCPGPRVEVRHAEEGGAHHFWVKDDGPGIAPQFQERIWAIFQTLEARDKVEGTGVGLAIVRKIVESRGGRAWVESRPGEGAAFHFTWPAAG